MPNNYTVSDIEGLFPDYDISEHIGEGGFKDVFRATLEGEDVVIKLFPVEGRQMRRRASRETRAMEEVDSPIFVDLIEHFVDEIDGVPTYVIVEEYIPGETLKEKIASGDIGVSLAIDVAESLLECLIEFQDHDLVHRDIKPSNIIVTPSGEIMLLDVGIVRFQEEESLTPDHAERGPSTPPYAAPEVLENDKDAQDVRTDLFSLGIVFYESVTGNHPFNIEGHTRPEAIQRSLRMEDLADHIDDTDLKEPVDLFYRSLTAHEQHERYRKPEHAQDELEVIMEVTALV
jgi:serine/threonine-protein kinase